MIFLKKYPFFLVLLPAFFLLHGAVENFGIIRLNSFLKLAIYILIGIVILFSCIKAFIKNNSKTAIVCLYISVWYLFFGAIQDFFSSVPNLFWLQRYSVLLPLFFLSTLFLIFFFKRINFNLSKLFLFFNVLLSIYCIVDIFSLINKNIYYKSFFKEKTTSFNTGLVKTKPNVYFMLYDGYAGYKSLKDSFSFRNDSLYQFLENRFFKKLPTFSNYNFTLFSMPSIFNMDYIKYDTTEKYISANQFKQRRREITNSNFFPIFEEMGYNIYNYGLVDLKNNPGVGYPFKLNLGNEELITEKMFQARFFKTFGWFFTTGEFSISFLKGNNKYRLKDYNKIVEKGLENALLKKSYKPQFVYLHFLMPHDPYFFDENAVLQSEDSLFGSNNKNEKNRFIGYVKYTNKKIEQYVNQILQSDSTAIIICMSDHGYRAYSQVDEEPISAVFDNICFARFPDNNYLPLKEKFSNVNFFRYFFNSQFNQNFPYLKDTSFFLMMDSTIN
jgi:Sulfatase